MDKVVLEPKLIDIDDLKPYENNPKKHPDEHLERLAASIKDQGLEQYPHIEPDGTIISGHGRWMACRDKLGWKKVPVYVRDDLTKAQMRRLRLAANRTTSTEYDAEMEKLEMNVIMKELDEGISEADLAAMTGFSVRDLELFTEDLGEMDIPLDDIEDEVGSDPGIEDDEVEEESEQTVALTKTLGFKTVTQKHARKLRELMAIKLDELGYDPVKASDSQRSEAFLAILGGASV
jgi:ParB-like chromosome segregation protein Spo0J